VILDDDRLPEDFRHPLAENSPERVRRATRREWDDHLDDAIGIVLGIGAGSPCCRVATSAAAKSRVIRIANYLLKKVVPPGTSPDGRDVAAGRPNRRSLARRSRFLHDQQAIDGGQPSNPAI
jgi:hypothetical protein